MTGPRRTIQEVISSQPRASRLSSFEIARAITLWIVLHLVQLLNNEYVTSSNQSRIMSAFNVVPSFYRVIETRVEVWEDEKWCGAPAAALIHEISS